MHFRVNHSNFFLFTRNRSYLYFLYNVMSFVASCRLICLLQPKHLWVDASKQLTTPPKKKKNRSMKFIREWNPIHHLPPISPPSSTFFPIPISLLISSFSSTLLLTRYSISCTMEGKAEIEKGHPSHLLLQTDATIAYLLIGRKESLSLPTPLPSASRRQLQKAWSRKYGGCAFSSSTWSSWAGKIMPLLCISAHCAIFFNMHSGPCSELFTQI